jgi:hypothetical protein
MGSCVTKQDVAVSQYIYSPNVQTSTSDLDVYFNKRLMLATDLGWDGSTEPQSRPAWCRPLTLPHLLLRERPPLHRWTPVGSNGGTGQAALRIAQTVFNALGVQEGRPLLFA